MIICQHASKHQPQQSARFPAHQPVLLPAMTTAANRGTHKLTTPPQLLHCQPRAPIAAPILVHLSAAPRLAATPCTTRRRTTTVSATTPQNQRKDQRNTTSSASTTGRIRENQEWKVIRENGERNVVCCSVLFAYGIPHVSDTVTVSRQLPSKKIFQYLITRSGRLAQEL